MTFENAGAPDLYQKPTVEWQITLLCMPVNDGMFGVPTIPKLD